MSSTVEISLSNLRHAQAIRLQKAAIHRSVKVMARVDGCHRVAELILTPPECLLNTPVRDVLLWPRRQYTIVVDRLLDDMMIGRRHEALVRDLTQRQRDGIYQALTRTRS